jgi:amphi-Trp domain-containing protein
VSDLEIERKESMSRQEAAKRLLVIAEELAGGDEVELDLGGTSLSLRVADDVRVELEVEVDGEEFELELELKWSLRPHDRAAAAASADGAGVDGEATGRPAKPTKARHR